MGRGPLEYAVCVNLYSRALFLLVVLFVGPGFTDGQTPTQSAADPAVLALRTALDKLSKAKESKTRFTYLDLNHTQNFNEKGKKTADFTQLFEVTYIADLQYSRLLEMDGKPLTGKALDAEQKRYDDAVRDRSALDATARAKIQHQVMKDAGIALGDLKSYNNTVVDHAVVDGRDCIVVDSTPATEAKRKRYKTWLDAAKGEAVRLEFTQLADEGDMLSGGTGRLEWVYMDGVPLLVHSHIDANTLLGKKRVHIVVDHDYSRFRKFSVTTTIIPVEPSDKH
jgi:hypothetical protein